MAPKHRIYAEDTKVPVTRSQAELKDLVMARFEADTFVTYEDRTQAVVAFQTRGRRYKIAVPITDKPQQQRAAWRQLILVVKAMITAVDAGVMTMESALLAWIMLPDGSTMGEWAETAVPQAYARNEMPALMPGSPYRDI